MQQDIRDLFENYKDEKSKLSVDHSTKFENLLQKELHQHQKPAKKTNFVKWLSMAVSFALLITLAIQFYPNKQIEDDTQTDKTITLGNISPELNTIESYYVNSINLAISELDLNDENKDVIDEYLIKIAELTNEYNSLTQELNTKGVNDVTINALISNLQLRLQLLQRLQKQLKKLNTLNKKQNEIHI